MMKPEGESRKSHRILSWLRAGVFIIAIVGAIVSYMFLQDALPVGLFWGVIFGLVGLAVLAGGKQALIGFLENIDFGVCLEGCLEGCCSLHLLHFVALIGLVGGFFIWHTWFLGALTGGGAALMVIILFGCLTLTDRKVSLSKGTR